MDLTFSWQGKTVNSPVYLHSEVGGNGEPCLLGTNIVIPLGLMTPAPGVEPKISEDVNQVAHIQLVRGVRIPAGCAVMAEVKISGAQLENNTFLFEKNQELMERQVFRWKIRWCTRVEEE